MISNKTLKVGIIGLGIGEAHIKSYQKISNVEVSAVCDFDKKRLNFIKNKYKIPYAFENYKKITENNDIQVVSICSYDNFHAEQIMSCLKNGKHVMVEKPAVLKPLEAEQILKVLQDTELYITSNLILRKSPRFIKLKQMIDSNLFGEIFHIEGDYLHHILHKITEGWRGQMDFYCTVYGGGIHLIDLMRWLMSEEIKEVTSMGTSIPVKNSNYKWMDTITSLLKWEKGATGKTTTCLAPIRNKFHSLNIYGTKKTFINDRPSGKLFNTAGDNVSYIKVKDPYPGMAKGDMLPDFINSIRQKNKPDVNEIDIFRVMTVCFGIWEATKKKKTIDLKYMI